jgi:hypothetical protein
VKALQAVVRVSHRLVLQVQKAHHLVPVRAVKVLQAVLVQAPNLQVVRHRAAVKALHLHRVQVLQVQVVVLAVVL